MKGPDTAPKPECASSRKDGDCLSVLDYFVFVSILVIWGILVVNLILTMAGYTQYLQDVRTPAPELPADAPFVSVMVPAHNEGIVICLLYTSPSPRDA